MTNDVSRRDAIKFAAVLAVGAGATTADLALGQQADKPTETADVNTTRDAFLAQAKQYPESLMLGEPVILMLNTDKYSRDLLITSAVDEQGNKVEVGVRSRCVRIFRADPTVDEFTSQGGVYWRFRDFSGKVKLKTTPGWGHAHSGAIVMVVREEETVRLYTMNLDLRC
ncbi:MAG TPA: twin-arginine translocation signal domain-containing protein [Pirellulales bacterium]|jgi:hypothetical protein